MATAAEPTASRATSDISESNSSNHSNLVKDTEEHALTVGSEEASAEGNASAPAAETKAIDRDVDGVKKETYPPIDDDELMGSFGDDCDSAHSHSIGHSSFQGLHVVRADEDSRLPPNARLNKPNQKASEIEETAVKTRGKRVRWGGKFVKAIHETDGNFSEYSDNFSVEGLQQAFDSSNAWVRTAFWLISFLGFGAFFLWLTVPLVQDYRDKQVVVTLDTETGERGLPLPIVTVCPHASGINCECVLWRVLHCRYRYHIRNYEWMGRFDEWRCWDDFDHDNLINGTHPTWIDPQCDDFDFSGEDDGKLPIADALFNPNDDCGVSAEDIKRIPALKDFTVEHVYKNVIEREKLDKGPYVTIEEVLAYAGNKFDNHIVFFNSSGSRMPDAWVNHYHLEYARVQVCTQLRPPNDDPAAVQRSPGDTHGIGIVLGGLSKLRYPLRDMEQSTPAISMHIDVNQGEPKTFEDRVIISGHEFFDIAIGHQTSIEYKSASFSRYKGWGSNSSQTCEDTWLTREACTLGHVFNEAARKCGCGSRTFRGDLPDFFGCSISRTSSEYQCLDEQFEFGQLSAVPLDICPFQCLIYKAGIVKHTMTKLSEGQMIYLRKRFNLGRDVFEVESSIVVKLGLGTLAIERTEEEPKVTFGELMGTIGGNLGLWCGPSFLTMIDVIEFLIIALIYSKGFYSNKGPTLKERASNVKVKKTVVNLGKTVQAVTGPPRELGTKDGSLTPKGVQRHTESPRTEHNNQNDVSGPISCHCSC